MSVNIKVTGGLNIEWGQIDPKATRGLRRYPAISVFSILYLIMSRTSFFHIRYFKFLFGTINVAPCGVLGSGPYLLGVEIVTSICNHLICGNVCRLV